MEKYFVPYELALKLKEIDFNKPCFFAYDKCGMFCSDLRTNEQKFNGVNYNSSSYTSAPMLDQVFDFFLEEYDIDILERPHIGKTKKYICDPAGMRLEAKNTKLEARLQCINEIIEIIKNK